MNFEEALRVELGTINGLANKVFPLYAPEGEKAPFVVYVPSEGVQGKSLQGYLSSKEVECEVNILQDSYSSLKALVKPVLEKLITFQGRVIGGEYGPFIQDLTYEPPVEVYEKEVSLYRCVIVFIVKF